MYSIQCAKNTRWNKNESEENENHVQQSGRRSTFSSNTTDSTILDIVEEYEYLRQLNFIEAL